MASSSYYYDLYTKKRREVEKYEDDLKDIKKILGNLTDDLFDEISGVNNELDRLKTDLTKSVRHNAAFTSRANAVENEKEKSVGLDSHLSMTRDALEDEVARVDRLRSEAISDRDHYYDRYREEKEEEERAERAALAQLLKGGDSA
ncbi:hypothetical protein MO973_31480 [Paenibacillus sp. TRM 82003]|nr:hypothetical protein [Paenibacillus sp. TRM 82003]